MVCSNAVDRFSVAVHLNNKSTRILGLFECLFGGSAIKGFGFRIQRSPVIFSPPLSASLAAHEYPNCTYTRKNLKPKPLSILPARHSGTTSLFVAFPECGRLREPETLHPKPLQRDNAVFFCSHQNVRVLPAARVNASRPLRKKETLNGPLSCSAHLRKP